MKNKSGVGGSGKRINVLKPSANLLAIDIGNTHTVIGVFERNRLVKYFRLASNHALTVDECGLLIRQLLANKSGARPPRIGALEFSGIVIASVVPPLTSVYEEMATRYSGIEPLIVSADLPLGVKIKYTDPHQVGADRLANAVAAFDLFGGPTIVVDLGTATTFDVISKKGEYLGGAIAPGIETSAADLFRRAAQLFKVKLERPRDVIGKTTEESLRAGIIFGTVGQIDFIVRKIETELGQKARVIATGGLAGLVAKDSKTIQKIHPTLTLEGLRIIFERCSQ